MSLQRLYELTGKLADAEERERLANKRLQICLKAAATGVWDWEIYPNVLRWDDTMVELFGYHPQSFKRDEQGWHMCTYADFINRVHPEDRDRVQVQVDQCVENGTPYRTSYRVVKDDGTTTRVIQAAGDVYRNNDGCIERLVGVCFEAQGVLDG